MQLVIQGRLGCRERKGQGLCQMVVERRRRERVVGETLPEAWSVMFSGCEAKGEMRAGLFRASDLLRMLAIMKEV